MLGRLGSLEVRLAAGRKDVRRAQRLRYKVFYEEGSAIPRGTDFISRRDVDAYDAVCDHVLVVDHDAREGTFARAKPKVVGTYRLLRQDRARDGIGFYTSGEFETEPLIEAHPTLNFLELGRSCVLRPWRSKRTVELLWHGVWSYVLRHHVDVMFGCASLEGTDPDRLAQPLSFLHHFARAPEPWRASALSERRTEMNRLRPEAVDKKAAMAALPPLIKGYLRMGAMVGEGAVIDWQFGTTDVLIVLPVAKISPRYLGHFGPHAQRHAA